MAVPLGVKGLPQDIADAGDEPAVDGGAYTVQGRSVVVLVNRSE